MVIVMITITIAGVTMMEVTAAVQLEKSSNTITAINSLDVNA